MNNEIKVPDQVIANAWEKLTVTIDFHKKEDWGDRA